MNKSFLEFTPQNLFENLGSKWITLLANQISFEIVQSPISIDSNFSLEKLIEYSILKFLTYASNNSTIQNYYSA